MLSHPGCIGTHAHGRQVASSCEFAIKRIQGLLEAYFKITNSGEQEKRIHYSCEVMIETSVPRITICHHSASLVMPNGDPLDEYFCPTITLMMDSYILTSDCWFDPYHCSFDI